MRPHILAFCLLIKCKCKLIVTDSGVAIRSDKLGITVLANRSLGNNEVPGLHVRLQATARAESDDRLRSKFDKFFEANRCTRPTNAM